MTKPRRITEAERARLFKDVFNTGPGRRLLGDLVMRNFIYDPLAGATEWERGIAEGRRRLAMEMAGYIGFDASHFPELVASGGEDFGETGQ